MFILSLLPGKYVYFHFNHVHIHPPFTTLCPPSFPYWSLGPGFLHVCKGGIYVRTCVSACVRCVSVSVRAGVCVCVYGRKALSLSPPLQTKHSLGTLLASLQEGQTPSNRGTETLTLSAAALMSLLPWRSWCSQLVTYMSCFLRGGGRVMARSKDARTDPSQMV